MPARITAFDRQGRAVLGTRLRDVIRVWNFPYPLLLDPDVLAEDLDGDGRSELLVLCRQSHFFPTAVLVYWPSDERWQAVLEHPGHLLAAAVRPDPRRPVLRLGGIANRPIFAPVLLQVTLDPAALGVSSREGKDRLTPGVRSVSGAFMDWYTILDPGIRGIMGNPSRLVVLEDGGTLVEGADGGTVRLDRFGNPGGSPNTGVDLRARRCAFMEALGRLEMVPAGADPEALLRSIGRLGRQYAALLEEPPCRIAFDVVSGRALAFAGRYGEAAERLRRCVRETGNEDALLLLGNLLGVSGRIREAADLLKPAVAAPKSQRANFDGRLLLFDLAVELGDRSLAKHCLFSWNPAGPGNAWREGSAMALMARAHLWWDEPGETDCRVRSWPYVPEGEALACLARWRLGRTRPDDPEAMRRGARENPDATHEFALAEAAALMATGHAEDAVVALERLEAGLRTASAVDFRLRQLLDLLHALHARALLETGHATRARAEARRLLGTLTPDRLPARLAREVAAGAEGS